MSDTHRIFTRLLLALAFMSMSDSMAATEAAAARLAGDGKALMPVVVAAKASPRARAAAGTLADYLGRIASVKFEVVEGDGTTGIAVGMAGEFPELKLEEALKAEGPARLEKYLLRSHARGLHAVGMTELAVEHAVWDLLYRLGHRQFFPSEAWEVVPALKELTIAVDANEAPDYLTRRIWFGFGAWDFNEPAHAAWRARNRAASAFELNTGHAYDGIISQYKSEFARHPEYLGLIGGERKSSKLCASNPGVQALVVRYARDFFARRPEADSVSIDPSDGGGWCECEACRKLGSPSDAALTLANEISAVLEAEYPGKYVGMYAYNQHSPPPNISARPRVIVSAATAFLKGHTVEQVIEGWTAKGIRQFGIREYYGVNTWDRDLPGQSRGSNLAYLTRTIPAFHARGARFMSAESSDSWGPNGLGFYLAGRMLWDVEEAKRLEELKADFFAKAFGPARGPTERFYELLDGSRPPLMSSDLVGRMYRQLDEAGKLAAGDAKVRARLDELALYVRYVELYRAYSVATGSARQAAFEQLIRHAWRMSRTMMIHSKALWRDLPSRDKSVTVPAEAKATAPEKTNPWKRADPWTRPEIDGLIAAGIERNRMAGFTPVEFGDDLVPADPLKLPDAPVLEDSNRTRGEQTYFTWFADAGATLELRVTGGLIAHYRDRGDVRLRLLAGALGQGTERGGEEEMPTDQAAVPPDGVARTVTLKAGAAGLYRVWLDDGKDSTEVLWPAGARRTVKADAESSGMVTGRRSGYFYVPRGTKVIGGYSNGDGAVHDADGKLALRLQRGGEFFRIMVPPGHDGRLWSLRGCTGAVGLMTVPPFLACTPRELLLPRAIVDADAAGRR